MEVGRPAARQPRRLFQRLPVVAIGGGLLLILVLGVMFLAGGPGRMKAARSSVLPEEVRRVLQARAVPTPEYRGPQGAIAFLINRKDRSGRLFSMVVESEMLVTRQTPHPFAIEDLVALPLGDERYLIRFRQLEGGAWSEVELIADLRHQTLDPPPGRTVPAWLNGFLTSDAKKGRGGS